MIHSTGIASCVEELLERRCRSVLLCVVLVHTNKSLSGGLVVDDGGCRVEGLLEVMFPDSSRVGEGHMFFNVVVEN